jgi:hypothetical protein
VFSDSLAPINSVTRVVTIPQSTATKDELISLLKRALDAPDYVGANWDAMDEMLRDLSWLAERSIVIKHDGVPRMPVDVLGVYLDVLATAAHSWRTGGQRELLVTFPESAWTELQSIAQSSAPRTSAPK